jgi:hypothetical protein
MNTVDFLRMFKNRLITKINSRTNWARAEVSAEIIDIYNKVLEEMIDPRNDGEEEKDDF